MLEDAPANFNTIRDGATTETAEGLLLRTTKCTSDDPDRMRQRPR